MNLPDLDESGVYTFESVDEIPSQANWDYEPSDHSEIDQELPPRQEVLEAIVTSRELASGANLDGAIARIASEIEDLKAHVGKDPVNMLELKLDELKAKTRISLHKKEPYTLQSVVENKSLEGLRDAEARLTVLEEKIGPQRPPVSLTTIINQLKQKVDLLALSPEKIQESLASLNRAENSLPVDKVDAVYDRLESLGPLLDELPQVLQRLKTLELLHVDSASSNSFLKNAEGTLSQMQTDIRRWNERLDKLEATLGASDP